MTNLVERLRMTDSSPNLQFKMISTDFCKALKLFFFAWAGLTYYLRGTNAQRNDRGNSVSSLDSANFFYQQSDLPKDCKEITDRCPSGDSSGVHYIKPAGYPEPFQVYCDVSHNASGWTVISRREYGGLVDFSRDAVSYKKGFGFLSHDFWIGNERLSYLTNQKNYQLLIEMTLSDGSTVNVSYHNFRISDEFSGFKLLSISQYSGATENLSWCSSELTAEDVCRTDCMDVYESGSTSSGVYSIQPTNWAGEPFRVYCNMADEGGWTVFQRRIDGSVDFNLDWDDYKEGFGNLSHEHWLGNEKLFHLTNQREYQIRIDVANRGADPYYAKFDSFRIDSEAHNYNLTKVGSYSGNADGCNKGGYNTLRRHQGEEFSTKDRDNDDMDYDYSSFHGSSVGDHDSCARFYGGAWWYTDDCHYYYYYTTLNGRYSSNYGFYMYCLPGSNQLTFSEMKIRPV